MPYFAFRVIWAVWRAAALGHIGPTAPSSTRARREATQVEEGAVRHKKGGNPGKRVGKIKADISPNIRGKIQNSRENWSPQIEKSCEKDCKFWENCN